MSDPKFSSFSEFYPFYLGQHANRVSRRLHVGGTLAAFATGIALAASGHWAWVPLCVFIPYPPGWIGHLVFEGNRPATWKWPVYSLLGDLAMTRDTLLGRLPA